MNAIYSRRAKALALAAFATSLWMPTLRAQNTSKALTNGDVVTMVKGGLSESMIVSAIQSQDTNFDISAMGLLGLKKSGVSAKLMDAVMAAAKKQKEANQAAEAAATAKAASDAAAAAQAEAAAKAAAAAPPAAVGLPSVLLAQGTQKQALTADRTQIVQTKTKPSSLSALAPDGTLAKSMSAVTQGIANAGMMSPGSGLASGAMMANPMIGPAMSAATLFASRHKPTVTEVWALGNQRSETVIHNNQPSFEVLYAGIPGINADEYEPVLLKLTPTPTNFRLVGATEAKSDQMQSAIADWGVYSSFVEERVAAQATKVGSGHYQLQPSAALIAGEYGVALRPVDKNKKFSGSSISQNNGDGLVFNSVWSFEVQ